MLEINAMRVANLRVIFTPKYLYCATAHLFAVQCNYTQLHMKCNLQYQLLKESTQNTRPKETNLKEASLYWLFCGLPVYQ